jgi:hypothetical protein
VDVGDAVRPNAFKPESIEGVLGCLPPHTDYETLAASVGRLVAEKQAAYGDSFGKTGAVLKIMAPDGLRPDQYHAVLFVARVLDKCFRILTQPDAFGESPARDIAGYALLEVARAEGAGAARDD